MMLDTLFGIPVSPSECMAGQKVAVESGGIYYVSPAIYFLCEREDSDGLKKLFSQVKVLHLPDMKNLSLEMTTSFAEIKP